MSIDPRLIGYLGVACLGVAVFLGGWALTAHRQSLPYRYWARYVGHLEKRLRGLFELKLSGATLARTQAAVFVAVLGAAIYLGRPEVYSALPVVAAAPVFVLERRRVARSKAVEAGMDAFITSLANALKSTPSIGSALAYAQPLIPHPIDQELGLALEEIRVGSTIDEALMNMGARVRSVPLDATLSGILIGRQVGGDLTTILETTAGTLREMARLHGVLRSKTAEGKGQLMVLAVFPALILVAFDMASPGYFDPLTTSAIGYVVIVVATVLWIGAVLAARKILAVDI
ncbi:MAG TPA: type II secretion system F family protein [Polyangiaceae bacterium]|nr:type II secretion system F family protein [Polyangiaceae bacterium]